MRRLFAGVAAVSLAVVAFAAAATEDPILTRQKLMYANGAAFYGVAGGMLKGEIPFDARNAASVLQTTNAVAFSFGDYFPEGSETGGKTKSSPKIWEDMAGFQAALAKFQEASEAAVAAKPQDLEAFKAVIAELGQTCTGCHDEYRLEDN